MNVAEYPEMVKNSLLHVTYTFPQSKIDLNEGK